MPKVTMRIAIVINIYWESRGGIEFVVTQLANHWSQAGHEVSLISYQPQKKLYTDYPLDTRVRRVNLWTPDEGQGISRKSVVTPKKIKSKFVYLAKQILPPILFQPLKKIYNKIKEKTNTPYKTINASYKTTNTSYQSNIWKEFFAKENFDIINFHNFETKHFILCKDFFSRSIVTCHEPHHNPGYYFLEAYLDKPKYNITTYFDLLGAITVLLEDSVHLFPDYFRNRIHVIPNITPTYSGLLPKEKSREPIILTVSRFCEQKNILLLLKSFHSVKEKLNGWELHVLGSSLGLSGNDDYYKECQNFIRENNLSKNIYLFGDIDDDFLKKAYLKSAIYAHPSTEEGWCLAVSDAMKYGLPCIGFADTPGVNFLIDHQQTGLLVHDYDRQSGLANALIAITHMSPEERELYGCCGHEKVENYSAENILPLWDNVLHKTYKETKHV